MSQAEFKKRLKVLMNKHENQICSDCPERQPRWASLIVPPPGSPPGTLPMGAFCCLECSGSHRRLGVHISFVRSINLDSWKEKEVIAMENGGNAKVNAIFEARLGSTSKPTTSADGPTRERFIRDKYERRKYFDPHALENYTAPEEEAEAPATRRTKVSRHPSEAARLRAEAKSGAPQAPQPTRAAPAPPAPAAQVDLLDFADFESLSPAPAAVAHTTPNVDLFADMTVNHTPAPPVAAPLAQPTRTTNDQIMAMFNTSMQPTAVAMNTPKGAMMMSMPPQNNPVMNNNNMQPNMMMQGNGFTQGFGNNATQQGGGAMYMQQQGNAMFMQQQGNSTLMMQKNNQGNVMLMQQGQETNNNNLMLMQQGISNPQMMLVQQQPNAMQMMQQAYNSDGFGFPQEAMGSGPPIAQSGNQFYNAYTTQQTTTMSGGGGNMQMRPNEDFNHSYMGGGGMSMSNNVGGANNPSSSTNQDPFSQFGTNVFR